MSDTIDFTVGRFRLTAFARQRRNGETICNAFVGLVVGDRHRGAEISTILQPDECRALADALRKAVDHAEPPDAEPAAVAAE